MAEQQERQRAVARPSTDGPDASGAVIELPVYGMDCEACAGSLELAIGALPGVKSVKADVEARRATVVGDGGELDSCLLLAKVKELGFSVEAGAQERGLLRRRPIVYLGIGLAVAIVGALAFRYAQDLYLSPGSIGSLNYLFATISPLSLGLAFLFGLAVAFAPSTYAMAPAVMGLTGAKQGSRLGAMKLSLSFVAGLATVDMAIGALFGKGGAVAIGAISSRLPLWYA
ncbi:MAG: cation transporter, partial [Dehalococcoidia bacterium]